MCDASQYKREPGMGYPHAFPGSEALERFQSSHAGRRSTPRRCSLSNTGFKSCSPEYTYSGYAYSVYTYSGIAYSGYAYSGIALASLPGTFPPANPPGRRTLAGWRSFRPQRENPDLSVAQPAGPLVNPD